MTATRALGFATPISAPTTHVVSDEMHAHTCDGVRWAVVGEQLPVGILRGADCELGDWLADGRLTLILVEAAGLMVWPGPSAPADWARQVQTLLADALPNSGHWHIEPAEHTLLTVLTVDVIRGELAPLITGHGGEVRVKRIEGRRVDVELGGHCADCTLADLTLNARLRGAVARRFGADVEINDVTDRRRRQLNWLKFPR